METNAITDQFGKHVFISYAHVDKAWVRALYHDLNNHGIPAWYDEHLEPGRAWDNAVQKAINECFAMIFVMTPRSVASQNCSDEWSYALNQEKTVIPLLLQNVSLPLRLHRVQYIDFTRDYASGLEKLQSKISRSLEITEELREEVEKIVVKRELERLSLRRRTVYLPPKNVETTFRDRVRQRAYLVNMLIDPNNPYAAASIYGRGGIGKTALACRVLRELEPDDQNVDGILYMSSRTTGLSLERLFLGCAELFGGEEKNSLHSIWIDTELSLKDRIRELISRFTQHRIIILLDNLEDILDADGNCVDQELGAFLNEFLRYSHRSKLLITSRKTIRFDADVNHRERNFPLEDGLPDDDAIWLLREFDPDGVKGLRNAPDELLLDAVHKTSGYPRALEYINAILTTDRRQTLRRLLGNEKLFSEQVTDKLMVEAQSQLNAEERRVMQAVSVYRVPISDTALALMLEPFGTGENLDTILQHLYDGRYLEFDRSTERYVIHPLDADYSYRQIPVNEGDPFNVKALHRLAASYFRSLRLPESMWHGIGDMDSVFSEFEHLYQAEDYDRAAELVNQIDYKYLSLWGFYERLTSMRTALIDKIGDPMLEAENIIYLAYTHYCLANNELAEQLAHKGYDVAVSAKNAAMEADALNTLGLIHHQMSYDGYVLAIEYHKRALEIYTAKNMGYSIASMYTNMGYCYVALGDAEKAIESFQKSLTMDYDDFTRDDRAYDLAGLAAAYLVKSAIDDAYDNAVLAVEESFRTHAVEILNDAGYVLVLASLARRELETAEQTMKLMCSDEFKLSRLVEWCKLMTAVFALNASNIDAALFQSTEANAMLERIAESGRRRIDSYFWRGVALAVLAIASGNNEPMERARDLFVEGLQTKLPAGHKAELLIVLHHLTTYSTSVNVLVDVLTTA